MRKGSRQVGAFVIVSARALMVVKPSMSLSCFVKNGTRPHPGQHQLPVACFSTLSNDGLVSCRRDVVVSIGHRQLRRIWLRSEMFCEPLCVALSNVSAAHYLFLLLPRPPADSSTPNSCSVKAHLRPAQSLENSVHDRQDAARAKGQAVMEEHLQCSTSPSFDVP